MARAKINRLSEAMSIDPAAFVAEGFDPTKELWKFSLEADLPNDRASGLWRTLQLVQCCARRTSLAVTLDSATAWSIDGYALDAEIAEPGVVFLDFAARSL